MPEEGMASNLDQRLGSVLGKRPQSRRLSSSQDDGRHELHQITHTSSLVRNDPRAFEVKAKPHFFQSLFAHGVAQARFVSSVEHQKTTATCANQFATQGAVGHGAIVPLVDFFAAHTRTSALLVLPMAVHQPAKLSHVPSLQRPLAAECQVLNIVKVRYHLSVSSLTLVILFLQDRRCRT